MLKTRMALGWSLLLQKSDMIVVKFPWRKGMTVSRMDKLEVEQ
jgi:hypothetical protein